MRACSLLVVFATSCSGEVDCGPNHRVNKQPTIDVAFGGNDRNGALAVEVHMGAPMECGFTHWAWVYPQGNPRLVGSVTMGASSNGRTYTTDAGSVTVEQPATADLRLVFDVSGATTTRTCTTTDGKVLTCQ